MMNFLALSPMRYKRSAISGMIRHIFTACSAWKAFHDSLEKAKVFLSNNQNPESPESFFEPLIKKFLNSMIVKLDKEKDESDQKILSSISRKSGREI